MTTNTKTIKAKEFDRENAESHKKQSWYVLPGMSDLFFKFTQIIEYYLINSDIIAHRPLLIIGDSGVGKSLFIEVARQIALKHGMNNYIRVNCASFEKNLADSELFGHKEGSFTDAKDDKRGIVEEANGGLLVLDEIGELSDAVQSKLLIFIEEGVYRPVGGNRSAGVNVKIIGTTNKQQEDFRPDFWYRFFPIFLPAFHERRLDVLYYIALTYKEIFTRLTPSHVLNLLGHGWPGNAREIDRVMSFIIYEDMFNCESIASNKENNSPPDYPLFFPTDQRQTTLVSFEVQSLCEKMISSKFPVHLLNLIIGEHGLCIPYSYTDSSFVEGIVKDIVSLMSQDNFLLKLLIQEIVPDLKIKKFIEMVKSNKIDTCDENFSTEGGRKFVQIVQKFLDNYSTYYKTIFAEESLASTEVAGLSNIYYCQKHSQIENLNDCFQVVCKLFLRDVSSSSGIFDFNEQCATSFTKESKLESEIISDLFDAGLVSAAMSFVFGVEVDVPRKIEKKESWQEYIKYIIARNGNIITQKIGDAVDGKGEIKIFEQDEDSLLKEYYGYVMNKYNTIAAASKHVGCEGNTLGNKLARMGLRAKRTYKHQKQSG